MELLCSLSMSCLACTLLSLYLSISRCNEALLLLEEYCWVETHQDRIDNCPEGFRVQAFMSLEAVLCMCTIVCLHYPYIESVATL